MKHDFNEHLPGVKVHIVQYVTFKRLKSGSIYQKLFSEFSKPYGHYEVSMGVRYHLPNLSNPQT